MTKLKKLFFVIFFIVAVVSLYAVTYRDVVYLKNGSIIKGTIIEQIPDESLKIETADGSVFVYSMKDVKKIKGKKNNEQ